MSAGGVPDGWVPDGVTELSADWGCCAAAVVAADAEELPESDVQPATRIPATRNTDAINMMMILFFMGYVSLRSGWDHPEDLDLESGAGTLRPGSGLVPAGIPAGRPGCGVVIADRHRTFLAQAVPGTGSSSPMISPWGIIRHRNRRCIFYIQHMNGVQ
jgi:hypothetical protein